jgi:tetratricopeptide (TPR) repeat protein
MQSLFLKTLALSSWVWMSAAAQVPGFEANSQGFGLQSALPVSLQGRVILSDGTPPSAMVPIQLICNGDPRVAAYSDAKGRFSLDLALEPRDVVSNFLRNSFRNESAGQTSRERYLQNCELQAWLPGFRSDRLSLFSHRSMDNPDLGIIVLHPVSNVEGYTISATSALAPKNARRAYEKALEDIAHNKPDQARRGFEKAVGIYPKHAAAWFELGRISEQTGHTEEARAAYAQALAADAKYISPYQRLSILAFKESNWQELAETTDRIVNLNPFDFPDAYYFHAIASVRLNQLDEAEKSARQAVALDPAQHNPRALWVLGIVLAEKRSFAESARFLRAFLAAAPDVPEAALARTQLGIVEKMAPPLRLR